MRTTVKVSCQNGNHWTTGINTTYPEAVRYFIGQRFVRESDDGTESSDIVVTVEEVQP